MEQIITNMNQLNRNLESVISVGKVSFPERTIPESTDRGRNLKVLVHCGGVSTMSLEKT